jgi:hypothetical protein
MRFWRPQAKRRFLLSAPSCSTASWRVCALKHSSVIRVPCPQTLMQKLLLVAATPISSRQRTRCNDLPSRTDAAVAYKRIPASPNPLYPGSSQPHPLQSTPEIMRAQLLIRLTHKYMHAMVLWQESRCMQLGGGNARSLAGAVLAAL